MKLLLTMVIGLFLFALLVGVFWLLFYLFGYVEEKFNIDLADWMMFITIIMAGALIFGTFFVELTGIL